MVAKFPRRRWRICGWPSHPMVWGENTDLSKKLWHSQCDQRDSQYLNRNYVQATVIRLGDDTPDDHNDDHQQREVGDCLDGGGWCENQRQSSSL